MAARGGERSVRRRPLPNMVPSVFVDSIRGSEPQDMSLRDIDNNLWRLKIEKFHDGWNFTDGWVKFVKDNMIKPGDVLYYELSSPGVLDFRVLGPSGREDDGVEHLEIKTAKRHAVKAEVKVEAEEADDIDERPRKRRGKEKVVDGGDRRRYGRTKVKVEEVGPADNIDERPLRRRGKEKVVERLEMRTTQRRDGRVEVKTEDADDDDDERPQRNREMEKVVDAGAADDDVDERRLVRRDEEKVVDAGATDGDIDEGPLGKQDEEKVVDGAGASVRGKRRRKKQDFSGSEVFKSGRIPIPTNPYFVVEVREKRVNEMFMPVEVVKAYQLELPLVMKVVVSDGREFHTTRKSWKDGRVNYCGGWKFLRKAIGAEPGDHLICEFIRGGDGEGEGGDLHIRVTLVRAE